LTSRNLIGAIARWVFSQRSFVRAPHCSTTVGPVRK
jgi:hypothetical protein